MTTVAVLGAGTMGRGVAQVAAQAGHEVVLYDAFPEALEKASSELKDIFEMLHAKGRLEHPAEVLARIAFSSSLEDVRDADWIIEAVPEDLNLKRDVFRELGDLGERTVLATNTSTLSVSSIAAATSRPERVVGLHFFNPAPLLELVEVVPGAATDLGVVEEARFFVQGLGKTPVVARDAPGFIVNRVARPFYGEALKLHGEGLPVETIDRIMRGLGFRMGPFELMDLIGIDVNYAAAKSVYEQFFHEPRYRPHPLQRSMVEAGLLGRKTGRGFYRYPRETPPDEKNGRGMSALRPYLIGPEDLLELYKDFPQVDNPAEADFVLDLYSDPIGLSLDEAHHETLLNSDLPVVRLLWGGSSSVLAGDVAPNELAGFSLVPPFERGRTVELCVPLGQGDTDAVRLAGAYFEAQGLATVRIPDTPGGVGFRILAMIVNEAVSAVAEKLAPPAAIDTAMRLGTNYPLGPLEWSEVLGLENVLVGLQGLFEELGEDRYRPHPLLKRMVAAGLQRWNEL